MLLATDEPGQATSAFAEISKYLVSLRTLLPGIQKLAVPPIKARVPNETAAIQKSLPGSPAPNEKEGVQKVWAEIDLPCIMHLNLLYFFDNVIIFWQILTPCI